MKPETKVIPMYGRLARVAAAVTLLIGITCLLQYLFFPYAGMQVVESGDRKLSVMLPDSSQVWLNKGSLLAYDKDFDGDTLAVKLERVLPDLERYYGVNFQLQNADLATCRFTASFQDTELDDVFQVLGATLQLDYQTQDKQTYTLTGAGCR